MNTVKRNTILSSIPRMWLVAAVMYSSTGGVLFATPAYAQDIPRCDQPDAMRDRLTSQFGESLTGTGVSKDGALVMLFESDSTFSIVKVKPDGSLACIVDYGEDWQTRQPEPVEQGS